MRYAMLLGALAAGLSAPPLAAQGELGVLPHGKYICALPGDATGAAWDEQPGLGFEITGGSSYRAGDGGGTYLLVDKRLTFTRGPMKGKSFLLLSSGLLQELDENGDLGRLRCHRADS